jgi:hypothetical protein
VMGGFTLLTSILCIEFGGNYLEFHVETGNHLEFNTKIMATTCNKEQKVV